MAKGSAKPIPALIYVRVTGSARADYNSEVVERQRRGPRSIEAQVQSDHKRWAITTPDRRARRRGWVPALGEGESAPRRDAQASHRSGIALASRVKVLVAHV